MLIKTDSITFASEILILGKPYNTLDKQITPNLSVIIDSISKDILIMDKQSKTMAMTSLANVRVYRPKEILKKDITMEKLITNGIKANAANEEARERALRGLSAAPHTARTS